MNKPGPKAPCPCGSGKQYKQCCRSKGLFTGKTTPPVRRIIPGLDYGIRPHMMLVGDYEYPELLSDHLDAVGYAYLPGANLVVISFGFDNGDAAKRCFGKFKHWIAATDSDALRISFIHVNEREYALCISQSMDSIERRLLPVGGRELYDPLVAGVAYMKRMSFTSSIGIDMVRTYAGRATFRFECMTRNETFPDLTFDKQHVNYYTAEEYWDEEETLENATERIVALPFVAERLGHPSPDAKLPERRDAPPVPAGDSIFQHRWRLLKRFFPATMQRLSFDADFLAIEAELLTRGYAVWQVRQAACNLALQHRVPHLFPSDGVYSQGGETDWKVGVIEYLSTTPELLVRMPRERSVATLDDLVRQIHFDTQVLLEQLRILIENSEATEDVQIQLRESGYLEVEAQHLAESKLE